MAQEHHDTSKQSSVLVEAPGTGGVTVTTRFLFVAVVFSTTGDVETGVVFAKEKQ
jgi:hypothetical protein